jgi:hypothetical protein
VPNELIRFRTKSTKTSATIVTQKIDFQFAIEKKQSSKHLETMNGVEIMDLTEPLQNGSLFMIDMTKDNELFSSDRQSPLIKKHGGFVL